MWLGPIPLALGAAVPGPPADFFVAVNGNDAWSGKLAEANAARAAGRSGLWFLDCSTSPWTLNYLAGCGVPGANC